MSKKNCFQSLAAMLWDIEGGYRGKSRKWARRRSKEALRATKNMTHNTDLQRVIAMATPRYGKWKVSNEG